MEKWDRLVLLPIDYKIISSTYFLEFLDGIVAAHRLQVSATKVRNKSHKVGKAINSGPFQEQLLPRI